MQKFAVCPIYSNTVRTFLAPFAFTDRKNYSLLNIFDHSLSKFKLIQKTKNKQTNKKRS